MAKERPPFCRARQALVFIIDTLSMNAFFFVVNMANETLVAGMTLSASLQIRLVAIVTNTLTARPYTLWRDFLARRFHLPGRPRLTAYLVDSFVFFSFQLPLYWLNMALVGSIGLAQMVAASLSIGLMAGLLGRPCGAFIDLMRRIVGVGSVQEDAHGGQS
jgi:hypothetical protein